MGVSILVLVMVSLFSEKNLISFRNIKLRHILIGIISAIILYFVFYAGNIISGYLFPFKDAQISSVYSNRAQGSSLLIGVLLLFIIGPGGKVVCLELSKPNVPILKNIYDLYFNHVLPAVGSIGTGDKKAYYYLRDSVNNFMNKKQLKEEFEKIGFRNSEYESLTFGIASIHYGTK